MVQNRVDQVGCDVVQRHENERPLVQARMRDGETRPANDAGAVEKQVQVQRAGPVPPVGAPAQGTFHPAEGGKSLSRRETGSGLQGQIQEIAGSFHSYRFCLIDSGQPLNLEPLLFQQLKTAPDIIRAPTQVTADADIHKRHG